MIQRTSGAAHHGVNAFVFVVSIGITCCGFAQDNSKADPVSRKQKKIDQAILKDENSKPSNRSRPDSSAKREGSSLEPPTPVTDPPISTLPNLPTECKPGSNREVGFGVSTEKKGVTAQSNCIKTPGAAAPLIPDQRGFPDPRTRERE